MAWYASFEAERTRLMGEMGLRVAIGNFSVGVPEPQEFEPFLEAVAVAKEWGGVLSLHEYSAPAMRDVPHATSHFLSFSVIRHCFLWGTSSRVRSERPAACTLPVGDPIDPSVPR